ncbi:Golgi-associated olfactory signaling regulator [Engystomops pustulosus]|uniref:Golgi-associated olfactory signaling regulator n=1 Tax=Engystomops pustulosus TaxID=76066 RepID=UPI003AFA532F
MFIICSTCFVPCKYVGVTLTSKPGKMNRIQWAYCIAGLCSILCHTKQCFSYSILPPAGLLTTDTSNDTNDLDGSNDSLELHNANQKPNGTTRVNDLPSNVTTTERVLFQQSNVSGTAMKNKGSSSPDFRVTGIPSVDLQDEEEDLTNLTSSGSLTTKNIQNTTHYKLWHFITFPNFVFCQFYQGDDYINKGVKTYFGGHKLLTMFLGMVGVLACLLILIYCIYIRQHKEEMFSHHRLYGKGFEDPVLHLDTPVDHLDFFSFRDTELTPAPTPQHKCHKTETCDTKGDYKVDEPKGTSSNELLHQIIQI